MLEKLLQTLRSGGTRTVVELAGELGTTAPLVKMMLEELTTLGYLVPAGGDHSGAGSARCSERCARCQMSTVCVVGDSTTVWSLATEPKV
jgi:hypothetical protein